MINTFSKFYYGIEVTSDNKYLDFDEGSGELTATLDAGFYTLTELAEALEDALNEIGTDAYTVTVNRSTRKFTIATDGLMDLLWDTGTNSASTIGELIGFDVSADDTNQTSITSDNAIGDSYSPQFKLQDYIDKDSSQVLRNATRNKSAAGLVEVLNFGTDRFYKFNIKFATNIKQPPIGPILNNLTGVEDLQAFMQFIMQGAPIEFMPDTDDVNTYEKIILESTPTESSGMGFELQEQYAKGLTGYYETGILKFRIIEV